MIRLSRVAVAGALLTWLACAALAGTTESFTFGAKSYAGSRDRHYKVYLPDTLATPAPLVMALHGCQQTEADVLRDWGLTAAADRYGFILVTPFITSYDGLRNTNCWGFWFDQHRHEGRGEPEDLHGIAREVEGRYGVDPARRYILGLSSGAAMAVVAATTHNEYWAAAASAAGIPYGEDAASVSLSGQCPGGATFHPISRVVADMRAELDDAYAIPLLVIQNERDCTVLPQAGLNLRDVHRAVFGGQSQGTAASEEACTPVFGVDYGCRHAIYTADGTTGGRSVVETVLYDGPLATPNPSDNDHGHYWIGGEHGENGRWSIRRGPSFPDITWNFFSRHPRGGGADPGAPRITLAGANPMQLRQGETFVDPGAAATDVEDGPLTVSADCSGVDPSRVGGYTCTYSATDSDGNRVTATRSVEVVPTNGPAPDCTGVTASPRAHVAAGRASARGWFFARAITTGDLRDIGFAWNPWSAVTLYEGADERWYAQRPDGCD